MQQNLLTECQPLADLTGSTGAAVLATMIEWGSQYAECAERHNALVKTHTENR